MAKQHARTISPERQRSHLLKKHAQLAERVEALDSRSSLTASEQMELQRLKKQKLWTKDALEDVG